jgi:hypothetical protein
VKQANDIIIKTYYEKANLDEINAARTREEDRRLLADLDAQVPNRRRRLELFDKVTVSVQERGRSRHVLDRSYLSPKDEARALYLKRQVRGQGIPPIRREK